MAAYTTTDFLQMQELFFSGTTSGYAFRKEQLQLLKRAIQQYEQRIMDALFKDLHKSNEEAFTTEIGFVYAEISHAIKHLKKWMRSTSVASPLFVFPSSSKIIREPLGVCLIISPWNY